MTHFPYTTLFRSQDKVLLIDIDLLPLIEQIKDELTSVETFIVMSDELDVPKSTLKPLYSYEKLLQEGDETFPFSTNIKENDPAGMCYTSATTAIPKGVIYTHR